MTMPMLTARATGTSGKRPKDRRLSDAELPAGEDGFCSGVVSSLSEVVAVALTSSPFNEAVFSTRQFSDWMRRLPYVEGVQPESQPGEFPSPSSLPSDGEHGGESVAESSGAGSRGGTATWIDSPSRRTGQESVPRPRGLSSHVPSFTLNRQACQGQVTA